MFLGPQALRKVIEDAELYPIRGLFSFKDFFPEIDNYYLGIRGDELGVPTGWKSMDELYKVFLSCIQLCSYLLLYVGPEIWLAYFFCIRLFSFAIFICWSYPSCLHHSVLDGIT
jgi:hypothetical protein